MRDYFFELIKTVLEINSQRGNLSTITDIIFFLWSRHGRRILLFFTQHPFLAFAVILTLHDTLLTTPWMTRFHCFLFFVFL